MFQFPGAACFDVCGVGQGRDFLVEIAAPEKDLSTGRRGIAQLRERARLVVSGAAILVAPTPSENDEIAPNAHGRSMSDFND
jgi:hypothetical protein